MSLSLQNAKIKKGDIAHETDRIFLFKCLSGDLLLSRSKQTKFQGPNSSSH